MMSSRNVSIELMGLPHVSALAAKLRPADNAELYAAGITPECAVAKSYRASTIARVAFVDGEIAAAWGMRGSPLGKIGRPWLLTAPAVERVRISFLRIAQQEVATMLAFCPELRGYVDARYSGALRLLTALGFSLSEEFPFGPHEAPFRRYSMRRIR